MKPSGEPGRMYGLPKVHKGLGPDSRIPPCRPIISNSGSNRVNMSLFVDHHSQPEVRKLPSFIEDTPHILRIIQEENNRGPQPVGSFPVTVDVTALHQHSP